MTCGLPDFFFSKSLRASFQSLRVGCKKEDFHRKSTTRRHLRRREPQHNAHPKRRKTKKAEHLKKRKHERSNNCMERKKLSLLSLRPKGSSLDSEHPSPESIMLEQRAPFDREYHARTASTLRLTVAREKHLSPESIMPGQRGPFDREYHARTAGTLRLTVAVKST